MSGGPDGRLSWLMGFCVNDDPSSQGMRAFAAIFFASGMAASGLTIYLASLLHLL